MFQTVGGIIIFVFDEYLVVDSMWWLDPNCIPQGHFRMNRFKKVLCCSFVVQTLCEHIFKPVNSESENMSNVKLDVGVNHFSPIGCNVL